MQMFLPVFFLFIYMVITVPYSMGEEGSNVEGKGFEKDTFKEKLMSFLYNPVQMNIAVYILLFIIPGYAACVFIKFLFVTTRKLIFQSVFEKWRKSKTASVKEIEELKRELAEEKRNNICALRIESQFLFDEEEELNRIRMLLEKKIFSDFQIFRRIGVSRRKGFYGVSCAMYLCSLNHSNEIFVMKIAFNYQNPNVVVSPMVIRMDYLQKRIINIPFHKNVVSCLYSFIDEIGFSKLPGFSFSASLAKRTAVFIFKNYSGNLANYLHEKNHSLGDIDIVVKLRQLISGVCHLKVHKICHRDLRPENIFLENNGSKCLIGEFGCCLNTGGFKFGFSKAMEFTFNKGGSPYYLSPEILTCKGGHNRTIDYSKNDIFSVGLIACKMVQKEGVMNDNNTVFVGFKKGLNVDSRILEFLSKLVSPNPEERLDCDSALIECEKILKIIATDSEIRNENHQSVKY